MSEDKRYAFDSEVGFIDYKKCGGDTLNNRQVVDLLNEQDKLIKELKEDNDQQFWKHRCVEQYTTTRLIIYELGLAIRDGYEISPEMRAYIDELKERNRELEKKYKRLEDSV